MRGARTPAATARRLRYRLRVAHKFVGPNSTDRLPRVLTMLPDDEQVIAQLNEHFHEDEVVHLIDES